MLVDDGVRLVKLFLRISDEEQLRRFRERITTPTKHWKITAEDIRNRAHRCHYLAALDDMFAQTSTAAAPWHVVPAEYKWFGRLAVAKTVVKALGKGVHQAECGSLLAIHDFCGRFGDFRVEGRGAHCQPEQV